jgi:hypothetical protein
LSGRRRYPRRGQFGSTSPRCEWCGIEVPGYTRWLSSGEGDDGRVFCSRPCGAAGRLYSNTFIAIAFSIAFIVLAYIALGNPTNLAELQFGLFILGCIDTYLILTVHLGFKVRQADSRPTRENTIFENVRYLPKLHRSILSFIRTFPANEGVPRRVIYNHMDAKNYDINRVGIALSELTDQGLLEGLVGAKYKISEKALNLPF